MEHEDVIDRVLLGLDTPYNSVIESINGRDTPISFEELHEKLINRELIIKQNQHNSSLPMTAFTASTQPQNHNYSRSTAPGILPTPINTSIRQSRPFLGKCQWCREQGHVVSHCPKFIQRFPNATTPHQNYNPSYKPASSRQKYVPPQVHAAQVPDFSSKSTWLLDSAASHHVTVDLQNLALHAPYDGTDELIIGDGTGLNISHTGSLTLSHYSSSLKLHNVLCVPSISRNIISISKFCADNNAVIEFSSNSFHVKDI